MPKTYKQAGRFNYWFVFSLVRFVSFRFLQALPCSIDLFVRASVPACLACLNTLNSASQQSVIFETYVFPMSIELFAPN